MGEALKLASHDPDDGDDDEDDNEFGGPDGNRESGSDLDVNCDNDEDDGSPGPVDGPSIFSEVVLAQKKGESIIFQSFQSLD